MTSIMVSPSPDRSSHAKSDPPKAIAPARRLDGQAFYWGLLTRKQCIKSLENRGDYLVRASQKENDKVNIVVSVKDEQSAEPDGVRHYIVEYHKPKKAKKSKCDKIPAKSPTVLSDKPTPTVVSAPSAESNRRLMDSSKNKVGPCRLLGHDGGKWYKDIVELIDTYKSRDLPNAKELRLVTPACRPAWLVLSSSVRKEKELGCGAFGRVYSGRLINPFDDTEVRAAIKTLLMKSSDQLKDDLTREARIMYAYRHENVVRIYGMAADVPPLAIVMELCTAGTVLEHLRKAAQKAPVDADNKMRWSLEAASGMSYLWTSHKCIHRDLAARNCLLADAALRLKISDFGLSKLDEDKNAGVAEEANPMTHMPIKWMAPETFTKASKQKWSTKSDVWSYGVLLFEIYSDGETPWKSRTTSNKEVAHLVRHGDHLSAPAKSPDLIKTTMEKCFTFDADKRPSFDEIVTMLRPTVKNLLPTLPDTAFEPTWVPRQIKSTKATDQRSKSSTNADSSIN